jgi:hypothetical protein
MVVDQVRHQRRGLALRPLWQVLTRISGVCLRTIVADWAKGKVCQSPGAERKSGAGRPGRRGSSAARRQWQEHWAISGAW